MSIGNLYRETLEELFINGIEEALFLGEIIYSGRSRLNSDIEAVKRFDIEDIQVMRGYVEDLRALLGSASILEQKAFLKSFVKRIDVSNSEITVNYTLSLPPIESDGETVPVLAFIQDGWGTRIRTWAC